MTGRRIGLLLIGLAMASPPTVAAAGPTACEIIDAIIDQQVAAPTETSVAIVAPSPMAEAGLPETLNAAEAVGFTETELAALADQLRSPPREDLASCRSDPPTPLDNRHWRMTVSGPLFPATGVAYVRYSLDEPDRGASFVCAVRNSGGAWRASCRQFLIWAR